MMFQCDMCGECCRNLSLSDLYADLDRGDGICKYLDGNLCSIYESRPLKCRIDDSYTLFRASMSFTEYYQLNYNACAELKRRRAQHGTTP